MICSKCGREISEGSRTCNFCGTPVATGERLTCMVCGESIDPWDKFCPKCGMPSVASQPDMTASSSRKSPQPEAKVAESHASAAHSHPQSAEPLRNRPVPNPKPAGKIKPEVHPERPVVPMDASASSEETVMVLDPPDVPSIGQGHPPREKVEKGGHRHSSRKSSSGNREDKRRTPPTASSRQPVVFAGGAVAVVLVAATTFWWFGKRTESVTDASVSPVASVSVPAGAEVSVPVAGIVQNSPAGTQSAVVLTDAAAASSPAAEIDVTEAPEPASGLQSDPPPALIVAPSAKSDSETAGTSARKDSAPETKAVPKHSRKTAPKRNAEEEYLRQIHRQLQRQRE